MSTLDCRLKAANAGSCWVNDSDEVRLVLLGMLHCSERRSRSGRLSSMLNSRTRASTAAASNDSEIQKEKKRAPGIILLCKPIESSFHSLSTDIHRAPPPPVTHNSSKFDQVDRVAINTNTTSHRCRHPDSPGRSWRNAGMVAARQTWTLRPSAGRTTQSEWRWKTEGAIVKKKWKTGFR